MNKILIILLSFLTMIACNTAKNPTKSIQNASFLTGQWEQDKDGVHVIEVWHPVSEAMSGNNFLIVGRDTLFYENIQITNINGKVYYKSSMGKYVIEDLKTLPLTFCNNKKLIFGYVNKTTSSYILYRLKKNKLMIEMRDVVDSKLIQEKYNLVRTKQCR